MQSTCDMKIDKCSPVAIFAFNRSDNLRQVLAALAANTIASMSDVTIFCDGPRNELESLKTAAVRDIARAATGFASVTIVERDENWGLRRSLVAGITSLVEKYGRVIVVEDDIVTSKFFLQYMNDALDCYANDLQVASISGFCVEHSVRNPPETFFIRGGECWGWATWKDRWKLYNPDGKELLTQLRQLKLTKKFDLDGNCPSTQILEEAVEGKVDSWFMLWTASLFLRDMYTLYPSRTLVKNIGFDAGTHSSGANYTQQMLSEEPVLVVRKLVKEDRTMVRAVGLWYKKNMKNTKLKQLKNLLRATWNCIVNDGFFVASKKILQHFHIQKK